MSDLMQAFDIIFNRMHGQVYIHIIALTIGNQSQYQQTALEVNIIIHMITGFNSSKV